MGMCGMCAGVRGYALVCTGLRCCGWVWAGVRRCAWICTGVCICVWDEFSEFLPENRVPTSADFNTYPIRILIYSTTEPQNYEGITYNLLHYEMYISSII